MTAPVTDPLSDQPMTEAAAHATLAWAEKWDEPGAATLARECLRLRGLLAEAAEMIELLALLKEMPRPTPQRHDTAASELLARVRGHLGGSTP